MDRAREIFAAPLDASATPTSTREVSRLTGRSRKLPREVSALRAVLQVPRSPAVTAELVDRMGLLGDPSDVRRLESFLDARSELVRFAALRALARAGGPPGVERVAAFARGPIGDGDVQQAILALAQTDEETAEEILIELSSSKEAWRRDSAMTALSVRGGDRARAVLHHELRSGPSINSWKAARDVAQLGETVDVQLLMSLAAGSGQRSDAALAALSSVAGGNVDRFLVELAGMSTGNRRDQLLLALGEVRDPAALGVLDDALSGPYRWRPSAWRALGQSRAPGALDLLLAWLPEARSPEAEAITSALLARPEPEARMALRALAAGFGAVSDAALGALAHVGDGGLTALLLARYDEHGELPPNGTYGFMALHGGDEGWELLEEVLAEGNASDRSAVVWALHTRGDEESMTRLLDLARNGDPAVAPQAQGALEEMSEESRQALRDLLVERINTGEVNDWGQSLQTLARLGGDEARTVILSRVNDGTAQERTNALSALANMDDPAATTALAELFQTTTDGALKSEALSSLLWSHDGVPSDLLDEALADEDPAVVAQVLSSLPQTGREGVDTRLIGFLDSEDASVRTAALDALAQTGGPNAEAALVAALDDPEVGAQAIWTLQSLGTRGAQDAIHSAAQSEDPVVRSTAISALGMDTSKEADSLLRAGLMNEDESVALAAVNVLQQRGNSHSGEVLTELLQSLDGEEGSPVRQSAAWALDAIGGRFAEEYADLIEEAKGTNTQDLFGGGHSEHHMDPGPIVPE